MSRTPESSFRSLTARIPARWHRRRSEAFNAAIMAAGPEVAAPPLAHLGSLVTAADLGPSATFRKNLRAQLMSAAAAPTVAPVRSAVTAAGAPARQPRRLGIAAKVTASLSAAGLVVIGVGTASAHALPGDALYGLKRQTEAVQLDLTHGDQARGLLRLQFASTRLSEVRGLIQRATGSPADLSRSPIATSVQSTITSTLAAMDSDTNSGARLLTTAFLAQPQTANLTKLVAFTSSQERTLTQVLPVLPSAAAATSLFVLHAVAAQTTALLATTPVILGPLTPLTPAPEASPTTTPAPSATSTVSPTPTLPPTATPASTTPAPTATPSDVPADTPTPTPTATTTAIPSTGPSKTAPVTATPTASTTASAAPSPAASDPKASQTADPSTPDSASP